MYIGGRHGGQACEHGAHRPVVLHGRHVVIDLVGGKPSLSIDRQLDI